MKEVPALRVNTGRKVLLILKAGFVLGLVRAGQGLLPLPLFLKWAEKMGRLKVHRRRARIPVEQIASAVRTADRFVPGSTCLTRALATQYLLALQSDPSCLSVGVERGEGKQIKAHAWLSCGGEIVMGGKSSPLTYATLFTLGTEPDLSNSPQSPRLR